ncbi:hypothetical protein [Thermoflavimicrobium dichotomicum]|uniref:Uncharacterized protein n=1 Tax=Thermoflavimicrobium dichotomicum TaxID=46223 RepID=A0A1I3P1R8_9BACL|nr:hypothetical protein [Thermoflavimicrobium dichotomicum]SFJ15389.1 hypothetical protein SAMN05421852_10555 [Thermoflavimicrobium dichotomicum]
MSSVFSPNFVIGTIRIRTIEGASCLNMGNNWPTHFESYKKHNQGFGTITGDNLRTLLDDKDAIDMINLDDEDEVPDWLKEMILSRLKDHHDLDDKEMSSSSTV